MNFDYDEDLSGNPFYKALQFHHDVLLQAAAQENWLICVPRAGYFDKNQDFTNDFILRHILVENNDLANHYTNLLGSNVILDNKQVVLVASRVAAAVQQRQTKRSAVILFEEVIYRTDSSGALSRFKLWCLDKPIGTDSTVEEQLDEERNGGAMAEPIQYFKITSFEEATKFLDSEFVKSKYILQRVQKMCQDFMSTQRNVPTVEMLHKTTKMLLNKIWNVLLSNNFYVKKLCKDDSNYAKMLRMAVENYASHFLNHFILDQIAVLQPSLCEVLNRKIVNLHAMHLEGTTRKSSSSSDGQVEETVQIVAERLREMESRSTVYDKLSLFKDVLKMISTDRATGRSQPKSSDDVLEILVSAVVRGRSMNWHPNLVLLKRFQFTECDNDSSELCYLVTTLEAVQQCILEEKLLNEPRTVKVDGKSDEDEEKDDSEIPTFQSKVDFLDFLFRKIEARHEATVLEMVNLLLSADELKQKLVSKDLCHPLCDCDKCQLKIVAETPTIASQDELTGNSCVHLVAKFGLVNAMRRILAAEKGDLDVHRLKNVKGETPMHVAGKFGQQNILLLLLHHDHGVNLNLVDMKGNTVLHLAVRMGHLSCVKALLYFAEHKQLRALQVNGKNYSGETSLHLAARAGFKGIVETLLEFTASKSAKDNFGKTAADVAFSSAIQDIIKDDSWDRVAVNHKLKSAEQKLDPKQVELVNKSIERGDVNLALHYLRISQDKDRATTTTTKDVDIIADLDAEDRVNSCTAEGIYPIHVAMKCNNLLLVRILVQFNVDFDVRTKERGETPFHWAARSQVQGGGPERECQAIKYVFDNVPNLDSILNEVNSDGDTVLHVAIKEKNLRLIHMLLKFNINYQLVNGDGKDAISLARELELNDMADYMEYIRFHVDTRGEEGESSSTTPESSSTSSQSR